MKERDPRAFLPQPGTIPKRTCPSLSLGGLLTPAGDSGFQEGCSIPTKYSPGSPAVRPPSNPLGPSYLYSGRLVARGSCLLDEAQLPSATGWIDRLLGGQRSRMQARAWLLRALRRSRSGEKVLQVKREWGWRIRRGEDQGPGAPGLDPAHDDRRPPPPNPGRLEGGGVPVSLRAQSIPPRLPVRASRCVRLSPPWLPGAAPGATLSALIRRAARPPRTSPLPGAAPALPTRTPCRCRRGRPGRSAPDGADTAVLHLTGRPDRNSLYGRPGRGPHPTWTFRALGPWLLTSASHSALQLSPPKALGSFYDSSQRVAMSSLSLACWAVPSARWHTPPPHLMHPGLLPLASPLGP